MKKLTKGTVLLFAVLLASIMLLSGCDTLFGEDIGEGTKRYEVLTLNDGGNISVTAGPSRVSVGVSSDDKVHLTYYEYARLKCRVTSSNDGFSIEQTSEGSLNANGVEDITILVPKGLGLLSTTTGSGGVTLTDISANSVKITGGSGTIRFTRLNADDKITITVGSGSIRGNIKGSRSDFFVSSSSGSGSFTIEGGNNGGYGTKTLDVSTGSGSGHITFTE